VLKAGGGRRAGDDVFLDFENAQPTAEEQEVYDKVKVVLDQSVNILKGRQGRSSPSHLQQRGCLASHDSHASLCNDHCNRSPCLKELESYTGAEEQIRQAISNSSDETLQEAAWGAVCPLVQKLKDFFLYSSKVGA
jgi:hypothetical protein